MKNCWTDVYEIADQDMALDEDMHQNKQRHLDVHWKDASRLNTENSLYPLYCRG